MKLDNLTHSAICHSNLRYCIWLSLGEKVESLSINLQSGSGGGDAFTLANLSPGDSGVDEIRGYQVPIGPSIIYLKLSMCSLSNY